MITNFEITQDIQFFIESVFFDICSLTKVAIVIFVFIRLCGLIYSAVTKGDIKF